MNRTPRSLRHVLRRLIEKGALFDRPAENTNQFRARRKLVERLLSDGYIERTDGSGPKITAKGLERLEHLDRLAIRHPPEVWEAVSSGAPPKEVAARFGLRVRVVHQLRQRLGVARENVRFTPRERRTIERYYSEYGADAMAERFGRDPRSVRGLAYRMRKEKNVNSSP